MAAEATNDPQTYIAETGWPTGSLNASDASDGAGSPQGDASVANLQSKGNYMPWHSLKFFKSFPGYFRLSGKHKRNAVLLVNAFHMIRLLMLMTSALKHSMSHGSGSLLLVVLMQN